LAARQPTIPPFRQFATHSGAPPGCPLCGTRRSRKGASRAVFGTRGGALAVRAGLPGQRPEGGRADRSGHLPRSAYQGDFFLSVFPAAGAVLVGAGCFSASGTSFSSTKRSTTS